MSTLSTTRTYVDGEDLTQEQLDDAFDSIETVINGNIDSSNIATGGVGATQLASSAVTAGKIAADAVTTSKILDAAVTGAKLDSSVADDATLELDATELKIKDSGVDTDQLADGAVTQAKRAALGQQISSSCGGSQASPGYTNSTTSFTDVNNLSVTIPCTGRLIELKLISDGSGNPAGIIGISGQGEIRFVRDGSEVSSQWVPSSTISPPSAVAHTDNPGAGSYIYKVQMRRSGASSVQAFAIKLLAYEA